MQHCFFFFFNALAHGVETFGKRKPKLFLSEDNIVKQTGCRAPRVLNSQSLLLLAWKYLEISELKCIIHDKVFCTPAFHTLLGYRDIFTYLMKSSYVAGSALETRTKLLNKQTWIHSCRGIGSE